MENLVVGRGGINGFPSQRSKGTRLEGNEESLS